MNLKKFEEYELKFSKDPEKFKGRIGISCEGLDLFSNEFGSNPVIRWGKSDIFEENTASVGRKTYNRVPLPKLNQVYEDLCENSFIPKIVKDRSLVKKMNFPITAIDEDKSEDFNTYGKYKKSRTFWKSFMEKPKPNLKLNVLAFGNRLLHLEEAVGGFKFDVHNQFNAEPIKEILEKVHNQYRPDFYELELHKVGDSYKIVGINSTNELNPLKQVKMYEYAYKDAYSFDLPNWFKTTVRKNYLKPYYESKILEASVVKPKYSIDYKKESQKC